MQSFARFYNCILYRQDIKILAKYLCQHTFSGHSIMWSYLVHENDFIEFVLRLFRKIKSLIRDQVT